MLHFAATEMCLFVVFVFIWIFSSWSSSFEIQKGGNFKIIFPVLYPIIYNPGKYKKRPKKILHIIILFYHKRVKLLVIDLDMNLEILLMGLLRGWCTGDRNWTGGVKKPPGVIPLWVIPPPPPGSPTPIGVCQDDEDISESGLLSKLFRTLHIPMLPSLLPVKTWLLLVVIVLIVELWAFISPTKAQVSTDHNLMYPALQPETIGKKQNIYLGLIVDHPYVKLGGDTT